MTEDAAAERTAAVPSTPEQLFDGHPVPLAVVRTLGAALHHLPDVEVRTSRSQVAFRRDRGFAYVWRPGQYLRGRGAPAVLSLVLGREVTSPRFVEVVHPAPQHWVHHLEVHDVAELDDDVRAWLDEAYRHASRRRV